MGTSKRAASKALRTCSEANCLRQLGVAAAVREQRDDVSLALPEYYPDALSPFDWTSLLFISPAFYSLT